MSGAEEGSSAQDRREGRGWLSKIDLLPEEAESDIVWALEQLRERKLPQTAILAEFNERLADRGLEPISKGAWSRFSVRKSIQFRKLDEVQRMSSELVNSLGTDGPDQVTVAVAEMLKVAAFQILEGKELQSDDVMKLSRALQSAVSAQKGSAENRRKMEEEVELRMKKAAAAIADVGAQKGVSPEALAEINRHLGVA